MPLFDRMENALCSWRPGSRRRAAVHLLFWSLVFMLNLCLYSLGFLTNSNLILVALVLSWLAITFTAADLVATTDVREA